MQQLSHIFALFHPANVSQNSFHSLLVVLELMTEALSILMMSQHLFSSHGFQLFSLGQFPQKTMVWIALDPLIMCRRQLWKVQFLSAGTQMPEPTLLCLSRD